MGTKFFIKNLWIFFPVIFILAGTLPLSLHAQDNTPKYSNEFLNLGVGGRAMAMANAQVAVSDDVTSSYWNPAGLLHIRNKYAGALMHASYFAGIANYDYLGFATPIDSLSHLGATILRFAVDDIPDTRYLYDANGAINYDNIRFFTAADYAFFVSYARRFPALKNLHLGGNMKIIHRKVGEFASAWGFGIDLGAQLRMKDWRFGMTFRDVFGTFNAWSHNTELVEDIYLQTGNIIPQNSVEITLPRLILGMGYQFSIGEKVGILPAVDVDLTFDGKRNVAIGTRAISLDPKFGIEFDYGKIAFLRIGVNNFQKILDFDGSTYVSFQPTMGLGVKFRILSVDYAFLDIGDLSESLYSHVFSVKVSFD
ncbi:MAG: PorV/PorQ family protein [Cyclobacteriaceae bacterium]|nr:PorV/PorQ family protein [Cyclobacteriaceae bacterium]